MGTDRSSVRTANLNVGGEDSGNSDIFVGFLNSEGHVSDTLKSVESI